MTDSPPAASRAHPRGPARRLAYLRDLFLVLLDRDMKLRYKRSVLGIVWSLVTPLAQLVVFYFVFSMVLPLDIPNYAAFLFIGILVWTWFQNALQQATEAIVDNRQLIRQPGFPPAILPVVNVAANLVHFLLALPVLLVFLVVDGLGLGPRALLLPVMIAVQYLLTLGLGYIGAALDVRFRDTKHLLNVGLTLGFYLTPIFYEASAVPEAARPLYALNPMVHIVEGYRAILLRHTLPDATALMAVSLAGLALLWVGYRTFERASYHFAEEL